MESDRHRDVILIAAAILMLPRMRELVPLRDSPALRCAVDDAVRLAEFLAKKIDNLHSRT